MSSGSLFYYVTYKYVLLKDARLGVLYYVLALLTVVYTIVEIFIRKGYMEVSLIYSNLSIFVFEAFMIDEELLCSNGLNLVKGRLHSDPLPTTLKGSE